MWAGDQTTLADTYDFVWKESMAEYLSYVYEDMTEPTAAAGTTAACWKARSRVPRSTSRCPARSRRCSTTTATSTAPGPMVLFRQLEVLTSRDAGARRAARRVLGQPHAISVDDVVAALPATTGLDLTAYAAAWIHGTGTPDVADGQHRCSPRAPARARSPSHQVKGAERRCKFHVRTARRERRRARRTSRSTRSTTGSIRRSATDARVRGGEHRSSIRSTSAWSTPALSARTFHVRPWRSERSL